MSCPTPEQIAAFVLDGDAGEIPPHVQECAACRAKFEDLLEARQELATIHDNLNARHNASRDRLLQNLESIKQPAPTTRDWKRFAFGGIGATATAAALLLVAIFASSSNQLSAMERMVKAIRE